MFEQDLRAVLNIQRPKHIHAAEFETGRTGTDGQILLRPRQAKSAHCGEYDQGAWEHHGQKAEQQIEPFGHWK